MIVNTFPDQVLFKEIDTFSVCVCVCMIVNTFPDQVLFKEIDTFSVCVCVYDCQHLSWSSSVQRDWYF